ncbi:MAG TPA: DUF929 family protein [Acidimicrobiales bacterium]|nr:DUF929 family protein [Acidimicrobiales bacterium]
MSLSAEDPVAPAMRQIPRRYVALGLIVVAIILLSALVLIRNDTSLVGSAQVETFNPAPGTLLSTVGQVPRSVIDAVRVTSPSDPVTPPKATGNPSLWQAPTHGVEAVPVVFFYGAEFAPYAAAERWPVIVALSRFGTFGQLGLMQSSATVAFPNVSSFTFWHATYSSPWLSLRTVERYSAQDLTGGGYTSLQVPDAREAASVAAYDTSPATFPLLDIANHYVLVGSSFAPSVLDGLTQAEIAADLSLPTSPVTQAVVAAANQITASICSVTGQRPESVCTAHGVVAADQEMAIPPPG